MANSTLLLPGQPIPQELLPGGGNTSKSLSLGPGLHFTPPATITATTAGLLCVDNRKRLAWNEPSGTGRYIPTAGDQVIATIHHSSAESFLCSITPYAPHATLGHLAFESANRKNRPNLQAGALVYARVSLAHKHIEPELECVHPSTGKADGMGELKDGMLFDISLGLARRLMIVKTKEEGRVAVLDEFGDKGVRFEIAVGRNGKVWVKSESAKMTVTVGRALMETDEKRLSLGEQEKLVKRLLKDGS